MNEMKHQNWLICVNTILVFVAVMTPLVVCGQGDYHVDSIKHHARELIRNQDLTTREYAFDYLNEHLGRFLESYADYADSLPPVEGLAILQPADLPLRIVTYQLYRDTSTYEYGGWIQSKYLDKPVFLTDASPLWENDPDLDYMEFDPGNWYGVLYYDLMPLTRTGDEISLLLFGLDNYRFFTKRKLLETLVIRDGQVRFGKSVIEMEEDLPVDYWKKRFILDYSVQAPATMRYDPEWEKIIFDHLMFMPSDIPQQRIMRVPDGTYSGFEIVEEVPKLVYIEKVFWQTMDEAPGGRAQEDVKRDLFGNPIDR